jgi:hypothetical protein
LLRVLRGIAPFCLAPLLFLLPLLMLAAGARAQAPGDAPPLAMEPGWIRLGHYVRDSSSAAGWRSDIHPGEFFLHPAGPTDPRLELQATLDAFAAPAEGDPDRQAQCLFPARWRWLKARLGDHPAFRNPVRCPAYEEWTRKETVTSLSIVFATGYLGNPASYYGHTLLKFNFRGSQDQTRLMDVSVNYGAILVKHDPATVYIVKSLTGGYDGGFSHVHFYFFNHNYGDNELRDLWEYRLDLPKDAVDGVVAHAWEVLGKHYTYRFFRRNCAYRMAEILQVVDGLDVMPDKAPWIVPQALIQKLGSASYQGRPLLAEVSYFASRQSSFYAKFGRLSRQDADLLERLVDGRAGFQDPAFQDLPTPGRQAILETLLDYYQFIGSPFQKAPRPIRLAYDQALAARFQLEPGSPEGLPPLPTSPHLGRPIGWLQLAAGNHSGTGAFGSVRARAAYYDALDADSGHVRNSALSMGDLQVGLRSDRIFVERLDAVGVESVSPGLSGLPGDSGGAWKMHVGGEQARLWCEDCLVARLQGDMGYGRQWTRALFTAVYAGAAVQNGRAGQGIFFGRGSVDLILRQGEHLGLRLGYEQRFPVGAVQATYGVAHAEARWSLSPCLDLRVDFQHDRADIAKAGLGWYW